ncbi:MAG: glycosyltransferase [Alphaproteobacteria bacterium]|nr:glycosyltransferase [Alphaproteobacteria bacterium]
MTVDLTIIVAAWNAASTIERCLQSALAQSGVNLEVVVADDCSTDDTCEVVAAYGQRDPRVRLLRGDVNAGPAAARNRALAASNGTWVAVLDADDAVLPQRAQSLIGLANRHHADIVFDNLLLVEQDKSQDDGPRKFLNQPEFRSEQQWNLNDYVAGNLGSFSQASLGYLKPTIRRNFLQEHAIHYDETLRNSEDYHLIAECLARGAAVWFHPQAYYEYAIAAGSISHRVPPAYLDALLVAEQGFLDRHADTLPADTLALLKQRRQEIAKLRTTEATLSALKDGDLKTAIRSIGAHPSSLARVSRHLGEAIAKRVRGS